MSGNIELAKAPPPMLLPRVRLRTMMLAVAALAVVIVALRPGPSGPSYVLAPLIVPALVFGPLVILALVLLIEAEIRHPGQDRLRWLRDAVKAAFALLVLYVLARGFSFWAGLL